MNGVIRCFISLSLAGMCLAPNLVSGLEKGNTVLVGLIEWTEVTDPSYGIRFFLPEGMETVEVENDPFEALVGQTEDGVTMVIQGTPQSVELDGLEEWVVEDLEIDGEDFELIDSEDSFHNLTYRLYESRDEQETFRVMVARHLSQDFSYVIYVETPTALLDDYDTAFFFWFTNIYGLEKAKEAPASAAKTNPMLGHPGMSPPTKKAPASAAKTGAYLTVDADRPCKAALIEIKETEGAEYGWWSVWHERKDSGQVFDTPHTFKGVASGNYVLVVYDPAGSLNGNDESDGVVVDNIEIADGAKLSYDFKAADFTEWNCLSCPWLYAWNGQEWVRLYEILKDVVGREQASTHRYTVPRAFVRNGVLKLRVVEEKDEVTFLDHLRVEAAGSVAALTANASATIALGQIDDQAVQLAKGQMVELSLTVAALGDDDVTLVAHGYYEPSMTMINAVIRR